MKTVIMKVLTPLGYAIKYGCIIHCTFEYIGDFVLCSGSSMEPTVHSDDILITEHISPRFKRINRGNVVIAKCPTNPKQHICKRIKGLPGDKIRTGFNTYQIVPMGHVWLEGDNKNNSCDSRNYGPVPQGLIRSRALCTVWPFREMKLLT